MYILFTHTNAKHLSYLYFLFFSFCLCVCVCVCNTERYKDRPRDIKELSTKGLGVPDAPEQAAHLALEMVSAAATFCLQLLEETSSRTCLPEPEAR